MYKCKQNLNPPVFRNIFTYRITSLFKNLYDEQLLVNNAFHTLDPTFRTK